MRCGIAVDSQRVGNALYADVQIERVVERIVRLDAEVAEATIDRRLQCGVIRHIGVTGLFDVADQAVVNLGCFDVGVAVCGADFNRGLVLARIVDDLPSKRRQAVDRQTRTALALAGLTYLVVPLLAHPGEAQIV